MWDAKLKMIKFEQVWDARLTEPLKIVRLGQPDGAASLKIIKQV